MDACPANAWQEGHVQTPKASSGRHSTKRETQAGQRTSAPFSWPLYHCLLATVPRVCAGWRGEGKEDLCLYPQKHLHPTPTCANSCRAPSLPAAGRPVMGIYFPQLRALVSSLSSSAWCCRVNERLHNEVITCAGMSAGPAGLQPHPDRTSHVGTPPCPTLVTPHAPPHTPIRGALCSWGHFL